MTALIIVLLLILIASIVISGIVYSRQQAIAYKRGQIKLSKQKYAEVNGYLQFILKVDDQLVIALILAQNLADITQSLVKLEKKSEDFKLLHDNDLAKIQAIRQGNLVPQNQKSITNDNQLSAHIKTLNEIGHLLQRFKIRGVISPSDYEAHLYHLQKLAFEIELEGYLQLAERLASSDPRKAINRYKQARQVIKRTRVELPDKNEKIRELTEKIEALQKQGSSSSQAAEQPSQSIEQQNQ
ncbi:hypothetical protein BTA51_21665 [Hahella sp. CCB-MM4]|uniref:hypothetical protein n=1 Tax=Hahella sp. (strain CCB-MM4) TaxID=1926491 RepID=UPI000B9B19AB|nr:hypothetical protein [Hahella sp. CCB-MM4]OZG71258.1 hypothetical protein BTA51_21665 [Hahella sp. CCB-MM4]